MIVSIAAKREFNVRFFFNIVKKIFDPCTKNRMINLFSLSQHRNNTLDLSPYHVPCQVQKY